MRRLETLTCIAVLLAACSTPPASVARSSPMTERQEDVAHRGARVMPFDLRQTTHIFNKTATGGEMRVEAKRADDAAQIELIREHLTEIAEEFREGRYTKPARIHGEDMPGIRELSAAAPGQIRVEMHEHPLGGRIDFRSDDPLLVAALHRWFDAQWADHGSDATSEHTHHEH
jgi:hypothetical protein